MTKAAATAQQPLRGPRDVVRIPPTAAGKPILLRRGVELLLLSVLCAVSVSDQLAVHAPPPMWLTTVAGAVACATTGLWYLIRLLGSTSLTLSKGPEGKIVLSGPVRTIRLPWEDVAWIAIVPAEGAIGIGRRLRCTENLLIRLVPEAEHKAGRWIHPWWDAGWHGIRFDVRLLDVTQPELSQLLTEYAGERWLALESLPADTVATAGIPGVLRPELVVNINRARTTLSVIAGLLSTKLYDSSRLANGLLFRAYNQSPGKMLVVMAGAAVAASALVYAACSALTRRLSPSCALRVDDRGLHLSVGKDERMLPWREISRLDVTSSGPMSRRVLMPWALEVTPKPTLQLAPIAIRDCLKTQQDGKIVLAPATAFLERRRHGLDVLPEQLTATLRSSGKVAVGGVEKSSFAATRWTSGRPADPRRSGDEIELVGRRGARPNDSDWVRWIGALAVLTAAVVAALGLHQKDQPTTTYTLTKQACEMADTGTVARFGLGPGHPGMDSPGSNSCEWFTVGQAADSSLLSLDIRPDLSEPDSRYNSHLAFGRAEVGNSGSGYCSVTWPIGHGLVAFVSDTSMFQTVNELCARTEEWASALAVNLLADTAH